MNKQEFLTELKSALSGLPDEEAEERIAFYDEMIDDRIEEGLSEEIAIAQIGSVDSIVSQIITDYPLAKLFKERIKPKRVRPAWKTALIVIGFPLWFPILAAVAVIACAFYFLLCSLILCLWAIELALIACAFAGMIISAFYFIRGYTMNGVAFLGAGLFCSGVSIFVFMSCVAASKGIVHLTCKIPLAIKTMIFKKESSK